MSRAIEPITHNFTYQSVCEREKYGDPGIKMDQMKYSTLQVAYVVA